MEKVTVTLPYLKQEIYIRPLEELMLKLLEKEGYDHFLVVADRNAARYHGGFLATLLARLSIERTQIVYLEPKPEHKDLKTAARILTRLQRMGATRRSCVIAFGGGFVADIAGFASSVYMRGIDFIQIPTTYMAMADCVIGKVAVNFRKTKNLLGSFYSPKFVFCLPGFLQGLPRLELIHGLVEVWKHAIITGDRAVIKAIIQILAAPDSKSAESLIGFSVNVKKSLVETDFSDRNDGHKLLSLGHTLANYLEGEHPMRHGKAVMLGIVFATFLASEANKITFSQQEDIFVVARMFERELRDHYPIKNYISIPRALRSFRSDKISNHGEYGFVIPSGESAEVVRGVSEDAVIKALELVQSFDEAEARNA